MFYSAANKSANEWKVRYGDQHTPKDEALKVAYKHALEEHRSIHVKDYNHDRSCVMHMVS